MLHCQYERRLLWVRRRLRPGLGRRRGIGLLPWLVLSRGRTIAGGLLGVFRRPGRLFNAGLPELLELAEGPERDVAGQRIFGQRGRRGAGPGWPAGWPLGRSPAVAVAILGTRRTATTLSRAGIGTRGPEGRPGPPWPGPGPCRGGPWPAPGPSPGRAPAAAGPRSRP